MQQINDNLALSLVCSRTCPFLIMGFMAPLPPIQNLFAASRKAADALGHFDSVSVARVELLAWTGKQASSSINACASGFDSGFPARSQDIGRGIRPAVWVAIAIVVGIGMQVGIPDESCTISRLKFAHEWWYESMAHFYRGAIHLQI